MFLVMILIVGVDVVYPVGNLHIASTFSKDSQSLAGGVFNVATRIGTSLGLAITSSIATSVSEKYNKLHPELEGNSPEVLMVGFRVAGWTCFAAASLSFVIGVFGLRGIGVVGKKEKGNSESGEVGSSGISLNELGGGELNKVEEPQEGAVPY